MNRLLVGFGLGTVVFSSGVILRPILFEKGGVSTVHAAPPFIATHNAPYAHQTPLTVLETQKNRCPRLGGVWPDLSAAYVTKKNGLPQGYVPADLVEVPTEVRSVGLVCVTKPTANALLELFTAARTDGIQLEVFSGYRDPKEQASIYTKRHAIEGSMADRAVAPPHYSEHQTGTAIDFTGKSAQYRKVQNGFEKTSEYMWLSQNAWKYGFNLSYPKTLKSGVSGEYRFEPWHWRYVGIDRAEKLHQLGISYNEPDLFGVQ